MGQISDKDIVNGIICKDDEMLRLAYRLYFPMVKFLVVQNNGKMEDAYDVFQDSMVVLFTRLQSPDFVLNCSLKTFIYAVSRNIWFQGLEKNGGRVLMQHDEQFIFTEETIVYDDRLEDRRWLFQKHFSSLPESCRRVIELFLQEYDFDQITRLMGFNSKKYTIKRKYECMKTLFAMIRNDPRFDEFK